MRKKTITGLTMLVALSCVQAVKAQDDGAHVFCKAKIPNAKGCVEITEVRIMDPEVAKNTRPRPKTHCEADEITVTSSTDISNNCGFMRML